MYTLSKTYIYLPTYKNGKKRRKKWMDEIVGKNILGEKKGIFRTKIWENGVFLLFPEHYNISKLFAYFFPHTCLVIFSSHMFRFRVERPEWFFMDFTMILLSLSCKS
uniref:Uncharacterized protein n=1 Tax=Cacopsylla melanoneura TaxID=428564 RepID=A0A8D8XCW2_9HEMI